MEKNEEKEKEINSLKNLNLTFRDKINELESENNQIQVRSSRNFRFSTFDVSRCSPISNRSKKKTRKAMAKFESNFLPRKSISQRFFSIQVVTNPVDSIFPRGRERQTENSARRSSSKEKNFLLEKISFFQLEKILSNCRIRLSQVEHDKELLVQSNQQEISQRIEFQSRLEENLVRDVFVRPENTIRIVFSSLQTEVELLRQSNENLDENLRRTEDERQVFGSTQLETNFRFSFSANSKKTRRTRVELRSFGQFVRTSSSATTFFLVRTENLFVSGKTKEFAGRRRKFPIESKNFEKSRVAFRSISLCSTQKLIERIENDVKSQKEKFQVETNLTKNFPEKNFLFFRRKSFEDRNFASRRKRNRDEKKVRRSQRKNVARRDRTPPIESRNRNRDERKRK